MLAMGGIMALSRAMEEEERAEEEEHSPPPPPFPSISTPDPPPPPPPPLTALLGICAELNSLGVFLGVCGGGGGVIWTPSHMDTVNLKCVVSDQGLVAGRLAVKYQMCCTQSMVSAQYLSTYSVSTNHTTSTIFYGNTTS